ncbi:MAG: hypothetical protein Fur0041_09410 [Bacteroidia bacterium]
MGALGLSHALNDFIAGALLSISAATPDANTPLHFTMYSALAFGMQLPAGLFADRTQKTKQLFLLSLVLMLTAALTGSIHLTSAILISGCASALLHTCGGALSLQLPFAQGFASGFFSAPGIIGLTLGGLYGQGHLMFTGILVIVPLITFLFYKKEEGSTVNTKTESFIPDAHDVFMLLLLLIMTLRSALWDIFHLISNDDTVLLLGLAFSAASGKIIGGWLSDRTDQIKLLCGNLSIALALLQFTGKSIYFLYAGIALLQSTITPAIIILHKRMKNLPAVANGLILGTAVAAGGVIYLFEAEQVFTLLSITLLSVVTVFYFVMRRRKASASKS